MKTETKHTPKPWRKEKSNLFGPSFFDVLGPNGDWVASVHGGIEAGEANARLIAACPVMADYVIMKAIGGDEDAKKIARSFGWSPER